jgi:hypothetical protein
VTQAATLSNPDLHHDVGALRSKAIESLILAIEVFNRPTEVARTDSTLILLHHSFEMLLKSLIAERTGTVIDEDRRYSYAFDTCLRIAEQDLKIITKDERRFLSTLDNLRDSAMHYYQAVSEQILYIHAQGSVSLFGRLLRVEAGQSLAEMLPARVLPICTQPPREIHLLVDQEFSNLKSLLDDPRTTKSQAIAALRPLMAFSLSTEDEPRRMNTAELEVAIENLRAAQTWQTVFPAIANLRLVPDGGGIEFKVRVSRDDAQALPVRVIKPGEQVDADRAIVEREINIMDKFNLGLIQLSEKLGITSARARAMLCEYKIQADPECFRTITVGSQVYKRYSKRALDQLRENLPNAEDCWEKHRVALSGKRSKRA